MVPVSMALVADLFPPEKRALPLGIVGAVDTVGWVLGHLYGGIMVQFMTWPYLFWINLPIIAVMFVVTWWGLAGLRRADAKGGIDWVGVTLLGIALVLLNVGLGSPEIASDVSTNPPQNRMYWVVGAVVAFVIFLISQRHVKEPILNLSIFSNRNVSAATAVNLLVGFCIMVALVSVPIFINRGRRVGRHEQGGVGDRLPAVCVHRADGTGGNSWRLAFVAVRLSLVRRLSASLSPSLAS